MKTSTALVYVGNEAAPSSAHLRQPLRKLALADAAAMPRVWMEPLEPRRMLSGASDPSGTSAFGYYGLASVSLPGVENPYPHLYPSIPHAVASGSDGKIYLGGGITWTEQWVLARLNADGTADSTFGTRGSGMEVISV